MRTFGAAWKTLLAVGLTVCVAALAACSGALPPPHVVDEAPQLARVAELLKMPPLRPVPAAMVELRPPYACGKWPFQSLQFAAESGLALVAGVERYAVMDIATGEVIANGAGKPGGRISRNGRVLVIPVEGGLELRATESGEVLVRLEGATGDEFQWIGDHGMLHVAPPARFSRSPRVVHRDLATGLETSLLALPLRGKRENHVFVALPMAEEGEFAFEVRKTMYELTLTTGPAGVTAVIGNPRPVQFNPARPVLLVGTRLLAFEDESLAIHELPGLESRPVSLPGFFPRYARNTSDPDRIVVSGHFKDEAQKPLESNGEVAWRHFYYSLSRNTLAPVEMDVDPSAVTYVHPLRSHLVSGERTLRPYTLPPGGAEGDIAMVLAAAKGAIRTDGVAR